MCIWCLYCSLNGFYSKNINKSINSLSLSPSKMCVCSESIQCLKFHNTISTENEPFFFCLFSLTNKKDKSEPKKKLSSKSRVQKKNNDQWYIVSIKVATIDALQLYRKIVSTFYTLFLSLTFCNSTLCVYAIPQYTNESKHIKKINKRICNQTKKEINLHFLSSNVTIRYAKWKFVAMIMNGWCACCYLLVDDGTIRRQCVAFILHCFFYYSATAHRLWSHNAIQSIMPILATPQPCHIYYNRIRWTVNLHLLSPRS